jgi:hypothetical protein
MVSAPNGSGLAPRRVPVAQVERAGNVALPRHFFCLWRGLPPSYESTIHVVFERVLKPIAEDPMCASI